MLDDFALAAALRRPAVTAVAPATAEANPLNLVIGPCLLRRSNSHRILAVYLMARQTNQQAVDLASLGVALAGKGQLDAAIAAFRDAVALQPDCAEAHSNLGNALRESGRFDEAIVALRQSIALKPGFAGAHGNLGLALVGKGQLDEAMAAFRKAIALRPGDAEVHYNLGNVQMNKGQLDEAIAAYRQAIALRPDYCEAHNNLGVALRDKGQFDEAIVVCRQGISIRPDYAEAYSNLGNALLDKGELDDSIAAYRRAISINPNFAEAHSNLGLVLREKGRFDEAIAACRAAISLNPDLPAAHNNISSLLLMRGDFQQGWEEYEWRWQCKDFRSPARNFSQPLWDGSPLENRTLLLHMEQGFGDAFQFIRYLPLVAERGGRIVVECYAELERVFRPMAGIGQIQIITRSQPLPAFDVHSPLLSLPRVFQMTLANIPRSVQYLQADAEDAARWQRRLADSSSVMKVGLAWAGNSRHQNDRNRSINLAKLAPLGRAIGVRFFSLQKGEAANQAKTAPAGMELIDWTEELKDFADTAALIANLDLIITVDTALAHLAGAMGKPVWMLLPFVPDWRWLLEREDSPWYPSMRLFRQPVRRDWDSAITRLADELSLWIGNRA